MTTALVPSEPTAIAVEPVEPDGGDMFESSATFKRVMEIARELAKAELFVPAHLRGKPADVALVLHMARTAGHDPVHVLQSTYVIGGKVGFSAQYIIALINGSGRIRGPVRWRETGEGKALSVTAYATLTETGDEIDVTVDMAMAEAEGWTRRNSKYQSMPKLMLRYRSATLLGRLYFPDVLLGFHDQHELVDSDATYSDPEPASQTPRVSRTPQLTTRGLGEPSVRQAPSSSDAPQPPVPSASRACGAAVSPELEEVLRLQKTHPDIVREEAARLGLKGMKSSTPEQLQALTAAVQKRIDAAHEAAERAAIADEDPGAEDEARELDEVHAEQVEE